MDYMQRYCPVCSQAMYFLINFSPLLRSFAVGLVQNFDSFLGFFFAYGYVAVLQQNFLLLFFVVRRHCSKSKVQILVDWLRKEESITAEGSLIKIEP